MTPLQSFSEHSEVLVVLQNKNKNSFQAEALFSTLKHLAATMNCLRLVIDKREWHYILTESKNVVPYINQSVFQSTNTIEDFKGS